MKWAVIIRPSAETDLLEAQQWYEALRAGLGDEFLDEVKRAIMALAEQPERCPTYYRDFRWLLTR